jgi:hypothetical protein
MNHQRSCKVQVPNTAASVKKLAYRDETALSAAQSSLMIVHENKEPDVSDHSGLSPFSHLFDCFLGPVAGPMLRAKSTGTIGSVMGTRQSLPASGVTIRDLGAASLFTRTAILSLHNFYGQ